MFTCIRNAVLTHGHRHQALRILTKCHSVIMDDMTAVFDLMSAPKEAQLELIDTLLAQDRLKETVTYVWKFRLQQHYEMDQVGYIQSTHNILDNDLSVVISYLSIEMSSFGNPGRGEGGG